MQIEINDTTITRKLERIAQQDGLSVEQVAVDLINSALSHEGEAKRIASVHAAIAEGEADIAAGRTTPYSPELMREISELAKQDALAGKSAKSHVRP